jgi:hypothetical protein
VKALKPVIEASKNLVSSPEPAQEGVGNPIGEMGRHDRTALSRKTG